MTNPTSRTSVKIGEISESINPGFPSGRHNIEKRGVPHLRPMNISKNGEIDLLVIKYVEVDHYSPLMAGDVLFNNTNSPELVGKTTYIKQDSNWAFSNHMTRIRPKREVVTASWMAHALHYLYVTGFFKLNCRHHVNQASISSGYLARNVEIPLPPLAEQERIVERIESLFTQLDAGAAGLKRAQAALKRYRASVLKAACEGRLVPQDPNDEPAEELLKRILAEKGESVDWIPVPNGDLPKLPKGWVWSTWKTLSPRVTVGYVGKMKDEYLEEGVPFLRSQNVRENYFEQTGLIYISPVFHKRIRKSTLFPGDIVVVRSGSVGVTCVIPDILQEANCSDLVIIQKSSAIISRFGCYYMNSLAKSRVKEGQVGIALTHFNTQSVAALPVPMPPIKEQQRIVFEVERRLSVVQELELAVSANLKRAARLRQAILKRAFEGRLVDNGPRDEQTQLSPPRIKGTGQLGLFD